MTTKIIDIGDHVECDLCSKDYTGDKESKGGFIFQSKGVCPKCAPEFMATIKRYNEERYIVSYCPEGMSFFEYILKHRNGDNRVIFTSFD